MKSPHSACLCFLSRVRDVVFSIWKRSLARDTFKSTSDCHIEKHTRQQYIQCHRDNFIACNCSGCPWASFFFKISANARSPFISPRAITRYEKNRSELHSAINSVRISTGPVRNRCWPKANIRANTSLRVNSLIVSCA